MSKDEALEKWLMDEVTFGRRRVARKAWHAAVAHTLSHVAGELNTTAGKMQMADTEKAGFVRKLADLIRRMEP